MKGKKGSGLDAGGQGGGEVGGDGDLEGPSNF